MRNRAVRGHHNRARITLHNKACCIHQLTTRIEIKVPTSGKRFSTVCPTHHKPALTPKGEVEGISG
jgi:hypothetical protein